MTFEVREVGKKGKGVISKVSFKEGDNVLEFIGERVKERGMHTLEVAPHQYILVREPERYVNHSCDPNTRVKGGTRQLVARKDINPGDEVTVDYPTLELDLIESHGPCLCESENCRGMVTGFRELPNELRVKHHGFISEHLVHYWCVETSYSLMRGMYCDCEDDLGDVKVISSATIADSVWNHGTLINTKDAGSTIEKVSDALSKLGRRPAFYVTPFCNLLQSDTTLESAGFKAQFADAWMFFNGKKPKFEKPDWMQIRLVQDKKDMELFKGVYDAAYSKGRGVYQFPESYGEAVLNSFGNQLPGVTARRYLAFEGDTAVGILSLFSQHGLFGIYNVGAVPRTHRSGIGSTLVLQAVNDALDDGAVAIFGQTEHGSRNERYWRRFGFETKFVARCYDKIYK